MSFMDLLSSVDWEAESYPDYVDFLGLPFMVMFFPIVRFLLDRFIFEVRSFVVSFGFSGQRLQLFCWILVFMLFVGGLLGFYMFFCGFSLFGFGKMWALDPLRSSLMVKTYWKKKSYWILNAINPIEGFDC